MAERELQDLLDRQEEMGVGPDQAHQGPLTPEQLRINARIMEVRPFRVQDELDADQVVIVAGYQGVSYRRDVTTLGRGGSDTSAVAMSVVYDAARSEIYTDVDGVYTADPRVVPNARKQDQVTFEEMLELAWACVTDVGRPVTLDDLEIVVTASAGLAVVDDDAEVPMPAAAKRSHGIRTTNESRGAGPARSRAVGGGHGDPGR